MHTLKRFAIPSLSLAITLVIAACGTQSSLEASPSPMSPSAPASPSASTVPPSPSEAAGGVSVTVETIGGHCIQGACDSTITIEPDGRAHQTKPEPKDLGTVPAELMQALGVEVEQADFEAIKSQPFTDTCPIAFDGQQFIYTFSSVGQPERIDSCQVVVDPENPLFVAVNAAIASVSPS